MPTVCLLMSARAAGLPSRKAFPLSARWASYLLARRNRLIPSARVLLDRLEQEAGMYLGDDIKEAALKTVGE